MSSAARPDSEVQELVEAYKVLGLELNASTDAIEHWYRELSLLNQPDRHPSGSADQRRAAGKRRQIDAAYGLIHNAPLQNHPLAKEAAARQEERVPDPGLKIDRPVSVATEVIARFVLGVVMGLWPAFVLYKSEAPGVEILVWAIPPAVGLLVMYSDRPLLGRRQDF
jgi:preprotein translocase subunit Sec63